MNKRKLTGMISKGYIIYENKEVQMQIKGYSQEKRGYIKDGELVTNFTLDVAKIVNKMEDTVQYQFQICTDESVYWIMVSPYELNKRKFLQKLPVLIDGEKEFYNRVFRE